MASLTGKTLGKYQVGERIGRGGMAEVYKGFHPRLNRVVAIKVLHSHLAEGEDFLARFEREAQSVAQLRHPQVVLVHDFDVEDDAVYMVMEFVDGGSLLSRQQELKDRGENPSMMEIAHIMRQVGEALDYAHKHGMIHRDVKPSNVLLDNSGNAFLADFGIAHILSDSQFTATGALIGTPAYMSPEQGKGEKLTPATDIYSLGIILYELLTGQVPFEADTPFGIIHKHVNEPLPSPRTIRKDIPQPVEDIVLKALAKEPKNRYQTAFEMVDALEKTLGISAEKEPASISAEESEVRQITEETPGTTLPGEADLPPTVLMDEGDMGEELLPTVVMEDEPSKPDLEDPADHPAEMVPEKVKEPKPVPEVAPPVSIAPSEVQESSKPLEPIPSDTVPGKRKFKPALLLAGVAGVVIIVVALILGEGGQSDWADCTNFEECEGLALELLHTGDFEGAIDPLEQALDMVPEDEHPRFAHLWLRLAEANQVIGQIDEAIWNLEMCIEWTEENPELEPLRIEAEEFLRAMSSGQPDGAGCTNFNECEGLAYERLDAGDIEGALGPLEQALSMVPEDEHPQFAHLWLRLAEANMELGRIDEAIGNVEMCIDWTEDNPEFEPLHIEAEEFLRAMTGE